MIQKKGNMHYIHNPAVALGEMFLHYREHTRSSLTQSHSHSVMLLGIDI